MHVDRFPLLACALLAACTTSAPPVHVAERFEPQSPYQHFFRATPEAACEAARRALLGQGYVIEPAKPTEPAKPERLLAAKYFQPDVEHTTTLQVSLVCMKAGEGAVAYVNAREQRYALKGAGAGAGLSLAGLGSITLPWGSTNENLVKVGEATITDGEFYTRFFGLVDIEID